MTNTTPLQPVAAPEQEPGVERSWFASYGLPTDSEIAQYRAIQRRSAASNGSSGGQRLASPTRRQSSLPCAGLAFDQLVDPGYLFQFFFACRNDLGPAPGIDQVTPFDLTAAEVGAGFRELVKQIKSGSWRPCPRRRKRIKKATGGHRTLSIQTVLERTLSKAINRSLIAEVNSSLPEAFHGFRPQRSVHTLLTTLQSLCRRYGHLVLTQDDIRKAFDFVPIAPAITAVREHVPDRNLVSLIETILKGPDNNEIAIAQGDPLSPTILLLTMSRYLSWPDPNPATQNPLHRLAYADNLLYASTTVTEGSQSLALHQEQLKANGMELKENRNSPIDLKRAGAQFDTLGFRIRQQKPGCLTFEVSPTGWNSLKQSIGETHRYPRPPVVAKQVIQGWINSFAPAFGPAKARVNVERIGRITSEQGIRELFDRSALLERAENAYRKWEERVETLA